MGPTLDGGLSLAVMPTEMNTTLTAFSGTLTSLNYPAHYLNNLHYSVSIVGPPGSRVFLSFMRLDLEWQASCLYDFLELQSPGNKPSRICGQHELDLDRWGYSKDGCISFLSDFSPFIARVCTPYRTKLAFPQSNIWVEKSEGYLSEA